MPYINFSDEDLYRANNADLVSFLESHGERVKRAGATFQYIYTDAAGTHDSVTISGGKGTTTKISAVVMRSSFCRNFSVFLFKIPCLNCSAGIAVCKLKKPLTKPVVKPFELPEVNADMRRVFAYLTKQRFINPQIISQFAHEHKIYEDKKFHNVVFVGLDENGTPKQAAVRSRIGFGKPFRITVAGSDTNYSFSHFGNDGKLFVFEAPIDMLSFITLNPKDWKNHSYIAINGVYESALLKALESHLDLKNIYICTDNDEVELKPPSVCGTFFVREITKIISNSSAKQRLERGLESA